LTRRPQAQPRTALPGCPQEADRARHPLPTIFPRWIGACSTHRSTNACKCRVDDSQRSAGTGRVRSRGSVSRIASKPALAECHQDRVPCVSPSRPAGSPKTFFTSSEPNSSSETETEPGGWRTAARPARHRTSTVRPGPASGQDPRPSRRIVRSTRSPPLSFSPAHDAEVGSASGPTQSSGGESRSRPARKGGGAVPGRL